MTKRIGLKRQWVLTLALVLLAACNIGSSTSVAPSPTAAAAGTVAGSNNQETCKGFDSVPKDPVPANADADGRHATFLTSADPVKQTLTYDVIQFLGGEEARAAYQKDSGGTDGPPNDYYIVNETSKLRTLKVSTEACLAVFETGDPGSSKALQNLAELNVILDQRPEKNWPPFWVTRTADEIIAVQQQWVP